MVGWRAHCTERRRVRPVASGVAYCAGRGTMRAACDIRHSNAAVAVAAPNLVCRQKIPHRANELGGHRIQYTRRDAASGERGQPRAHFSVARVRNEGTHLDMPIACALCVLVMSHSSRRIGGVNACSLCCLKAPPPPRARPRARNQRCTCIHARRSMWMQTAVASATRSASLCSPRTARSRTRTPATA